MFKSFSAFVLPFVVVVVVVVVVDDVFRSLAGLVD